MNTFSMEPAFCAVKLSCGEMNKMGFRLAFLRAHPPHSTPTSPSGFTNFAHLPQVPFPSSSFFLFFCLSSTIQFPLPLLVSIFLPSYVSLAPSFSAPPPLYPCLHMLCLGSFTWLEERKRRGEERASLNYTCSSSSAPIQSGPTRCLPSRFTAFVSFASLNMHLLYLCLFYCMCVFLCVVLFNNFRMGTTIFIEQGRRL